MAEYRAEILNTGTGRLILCLELVAGKGVHQFAKSTTTLQLEIQRYPILSFGYVQSHDKIKFNKRIVTYDARIRA